METYDLSNPRIVAALWSNLQEPGDEAAGTLRDALGSATALDLVLSQHTPRDLARRLGEHPAARAFDWDKAWKRWRERIDTIHLEHDFAQLERIGGWLIHAQHPAWPTQVNELGPAAPVAIWGRGPLYPGGSFRAGGAGGDDEPDGRTQPTRGEGRDAHEEADSRSGLPPGAQPGPNQPADETTTAPDADFNEGGNTAGTRPRTVAVVGARACSAEGERAAYELGYELAHAGISVISGGAFGIDVAAHRGALAAGHTLAVMAGGVSQLYPRAHLEVFDQILQSGGGIISEVPPFWRPARWRFLSRNRIIAALADAVVMVEAGVRSGAVVTLKRAQEMGREIAAYPGSSRNVIAQGCNQAIRNGATLVTSHEEVLELLAPIGTNIEMEQFHLPLPGLPQDQQRVWDAMPKRSGATARAIARVAGLGEDETLEILARLVLKGMVSTLGEKFSRT